MKILQVLNHFLPHQTAGTEVYTWALSKQLAVAGNEVEIVIPNYGSAVFESYDYDGLRVHKYPETSVVDRALQMGFKKTNGLTFFTEYLKINRPDIVHFHELAGSNGISLHHVIAAKEIGLKTVFTFHLASNTCKTGTLIYNEETMCDGKINIRKCSSCYLHHKGFSKPKEILVPLSNLLYKAGIDTTKWNSKIGTGFGTAFLIAKQKKDFDLLIDNCDKVIVLTKWYQKILLLNGVLPEKIQFIPQGLPHVPVTAYNNAPLKRDSCLRLIFLGRISYFKGLHILIDSLLQLTQKDITLDIYGQSDCPDYEQILKQKSKNFSNITWHGKLEPKEVIKTMQQYDVLCLCSTFSEMSPLVIQEAFAAGLPVLASDVYGNAEQIKHNENGWLFKFKDANSLKAQLQTLMGNLFLIEVAKKNIKPVRTFEAVAKEQLKVYQKVLQGL